MRYLDVSVAILIGVSAISAIIAWSPRDSDAASRHLAEQIRLRDGLLAYVEGRGVAWVLSAPPELLCADLAVHSNSTFTMSGMEGEAECTRPPAGVAAVSLTLNLPQREVNLEAWGPGSG